MEPNFNFDNDDETLTMEQKNNNEELSNQGADIPAPTRRTVTIRESELRAYNSAGYNRTRIAEQYGVTPQDIYRAMVDFGMLEARTAKNNPEYVVELVHDCPFLH
jgi:hypothetical protein